MSTSTADSAYQTLRVRMKEKLVARRKNSTACPWVIRSGGRWAQRLADGKSGDAPAPAVHQGDQRAAARERGEHGGGDAQDQHDREAAYRPRADHIERQTRDQRRDIRVEDCRECLVEARAHRRLRGNAVAQLLAD